METQLAILERKIDELLASVDLPSERDPIPPEEESLDVAGGLDGAGEEIDPSTTDKNRSTGSGSDAGAVEQPKKGKEGVEA